MSELERVKGEIRQSNLLLRSVLVILICALGATYASQIKDGFEVSTGKKTKSSYSVRVDEVDLHQLYKNQAAILDATTGGRKYGKRRTLNLNEEKKLIRTKQKKMMSKTQPNLVRRQG